jgi:hypothetical protein
VTAPRPTDRRSGLQRFTPDDLAQQAERQRFLAELRERHAARARAGRAAWRVRRARLARRTEEPSAPEDTPQ